ncbi:MAG TPA: hypothetical protein VGM81_11605 [Burkholderiaceae bacterium]|jgi:hypothetical protein
MPTLIAIPMPAVLNLPNAGNVDASDPIGAGLKARARCQIRRPGMGQPKEPGLSAALFKERGQARTIHRKS